MSAYLPTVVLGALVLYLFWQLARISKRNGELTNANFELRRRVDEAADALDAYREPLPQHAELIEWMRSDAGLLDTKV